MCLCVQDAREDGGGGRHSVAAGAAPRGTAGAVLREAQRSSAGDQVRCHHMPVLKSLLL